MSRKCHNVYTVYHFIYESPPKTCTVHYCVCPFLPHLILLTCMPLTDFTFQSSFSSNSRISLLDTILPYVKGRYNWATPDSESSITYKNW